MIPLNDADRRHAATTHPAAEQLHVGRPVHRLRYLADMAAGADVLDLGCLDETATRKREGDVWLHGRLGRVARSLVGVDNSELVPEEGLSTGFSRIIRGDVMALTRQSVGDPDVIIAGELIEHLDSPVAFLRHMATAFRGSTLVATTPNATGLTNILLGLGRRESAHPDHVCVFSYKTLRQVAERAGLADFCVRPYAVEYSEVRLGRSPSFRMLVWGVERGVRAVERLVPLWSGGWILTAKL